MKEKLIGFITLAIIIIMLLLNLLQGRGMENLNQYKEKQRNIIAQDDYVKSQFEPNWRIEVKAYDNHEEALKLLKELEQISVNAHIDKREVGENTLYKVRIFQKNENDNLKSTIKRLEKNNYSYQVLKLSQQ